MSFYVIIYNAITKAITLVVLKIATELHALFHYICYQQLIYVNVMAMGDKLLLRFSPKVQSKFIMTWEITKCLIATFPISQRQDGVQYRKP